MRNLRTLLLSLSCLSAAGCTASFTEPQPVTSQEQLNDSMRTLWVAQATWTRVYLMAAIDGLGDADAAAARLLQNQNDIAAALKPFYGRAGEEAVSGLLRKHIAIALEVVTAAKAQDGAALADARARWVANAEALAVYLADANSHWSQAALIALMRGHLDQTVAEATARVARDWDADVKAHDAVVQHAVQFSDVLSDGIGAQFPQRVAPGSSNDGGSHGLHRAMRALWADHASWTRVYLISAIGGLPDVNVAAVRLLQNQTEIGEALEPYYGDVSAAALTALLEEDVGLGTEVVTAARANDAVALASARARWADNGDRIADFLAGTNPHWELDQLKSMLRTHRNLTFSEASARLTGDWAADVRAYDAVVAHLAHFADLLSAGIASQFAPPG